MGSVAALRVAPVKGLATVPREHVRLEAAGVAEDRRAFLLDARGAVVTLRQHPGLVQVVPSLDLERGVLEVRLPDGTMHSSPLEDADLRVRAELYGKQRVGRVLPGAVAETLSQRAGETLRVVIADEPGTGWDEGPVSILGRASAAAVGGVGRDRARYRMLVEVDGTAPYEEDGWVGHDLMLGQARVRVVHRLVRCVIITQSPTDGRKDWEGLHALAQQGREDLCLGVIAEVVTPGDVRIGDAVRLASMT